MTKYKVNGGDKSERGDEVISLEVEQNPLRDERERGMDMYGNVRSHLGTQLGVRICDPNTLLVFKICTLYLYFLRTNITYSLLPLSFTLCLTLDFTLCVTCETPPESVLDSSCLSLSLWSLELILAVLVAMGSQ